MKGFKGFVIKTVCALIFLLALTLGIVIYASAEDMLKGRATVYSLEGNTKMGTPARWGTCASGNESLIGKTVIIFQRLPDDSKGDVLGIYRVEDTGCKEEVIDIWCPKEYQKAIIGKTYEKGCEGRIYIQIVEDNK